MAARFGVARSASGLLAAIAGLSTAHLIAQFFAPTSSPVIAVGGAAIDAAPTPLKEWAIREFGTNDKLVLLSGISFVLALLAIGIGVLAARDFRIGAAALTALGLVAGAAALNRPTADATYAIPTVVGLLVALAVLWRLTRPLSSVARDGPTRGVRVEGSRREFLITGVGVGAVSAVALAAGTQVARSKSIQSARRAVQLPQTADVGPAQPPGTDPAIPGITSFITSNGDFYRVDTALIVPQVNPSSWRLRVEGMVGQPFSVSYADLLAMPMIERDITLTCVSNEVGGQYAGNARWLGVPLKAFLADANIDPAADQLLCRSTDGFTSSVSRVLALDGRDSMIAIGMNGEPLPSQHGFPARLVIPGLYGYVSACKWLSSIKATTFADQQAYWTQRGWAEQAPILTSTRIDVPRQGRAVSAGRVAIAGVAWAQHRGIAKVQVQVDDGPWLQANLAPTPSVDTWRQWWLAWEATAGLHQIRARATDGTGELQTADEAAPFPSGATGWDQQTISVT
jgi:DMSO/TMAO reductase YedYZ molybdopterin-dependent catalytic subunit